MLLPAALQGVILFELLTRQDPNDGKATSSVLAEVSSISQVQNCCCPEGPRIANSSEQQPKRQPSCHLT